MHLDAVAFHSSDPGTAYPQFQSIFTPSIAEFYRSGGRPDRSSVKFGRLRLPTK